MSRGLRQRFLLLAPLLGAIACGGASEPKRVLPALGEYSYSLHVPFTPAAQNEVQYTGTLRITFASFDSIAASVSVPNGFYPAFNRNFEGLLPTIRYGDWRSDAYYFWVQGANNGPTVAHQLTATKTGVNCESFQLIFSPGGLPTSVPTTCVLTYRGP